MKTSINFIKYMVIVIVLLLLLMLLFPTWTSSIKGSTSISALEQVEINGTGHEIMIRGQDKANPVIIFVHGGPGCSEIPYVKKYQDLLETEFTSNLHTIHNSKKRKDSLNGCTQLLNNKSLFL